MNDGNRILVHRVGDHAPWTAPESSSYVNEAHLQEVLAASPHWVPGVPEGSLSVRELYTSAGPVDVVIVAPDGAITVVECKLESNAEKRRMVIGQLIDYAAAITADGHERFHAAWAARGGPDLGSLLDPEGVEELRSRIETATIGLCLAVDRIDADLRRLVEYLNRATHDGIAVTALQLAYARHADLELLVPSTYGGEIAAAKATHGSPGSSDHWTRETFVDTVEDPTDKAFLVRVLECLDAPSQHLGSHDPLWFGVRPGGGMFVFPFGYRHPPLQFAINGAGRLTIRGCWQRFAEVARHPGFAELAAMLGQDENGPTRFVPVAELDPDVVWEVAERAAHAINS